jgi:hypothetical protein
MGTTMKLIHRNKSAWRQRHKLLFGLAVLTDGLVRTLSLGLLYSDFSLQAAKYATKNMVKPSAAQLIARALDKLPVRPSKD